jgi:hypothetical protein
MELFIDQKVIDSIFKGMCYEDFIEYVDMDVVTCLTMADEPEDVLWVDRSRGIWRDKWEALQEVTAEVISGICTITESEGWAGQSHDGLYPAAPARVEALENCGGLSCGIIQKAHR